MILVTGSTGTIGSEVVRLLSAARVPTRALARSAEKAAAIRAPGIEVVLGDFEDASSLDAALAGVDRLFLLSSVHPSMAELQGNVVRAAARAGTRHIVKLGAANVALDSPISVGRAHAQVEALIAESGIPHTFLRPTLFMQSLFMHAASICSQGAFYLPVRRGAVAMVDARDIAAVAAAALTRPGHEGRAYVLTGPAALRMDEVAAALSAATGRTVRYVDVAPDAARKGMLTQGIPDWFVDDLLKLMEDFADGAGAQVSGAVEEATGRRARPFEEFAREFAAAFTP